MTHVGGCHCGAVRYRIEGEPSHVDLCHCVDCRRNSGAPVVCWAGFQETDLTLEKGQPKTFNSSGSALRDAPIAVRASSTAMPACSPGLSKSSQPRWMTLTRCRRTSTSKRQNGSAGWSVPTNCHL